MAKKKAAKKVNAAPVEKASKPVRLELSSPDHERLEACAAHLGLSLASFARMAVLKLMTEVEREKSR